MKSLFCLLVWAVGTVVASAQTDRTATLEAILHVTKVRDVLANTPDQFLQAFEQSAPGGAAPSAEMQRLVAHHFADTTLYRYVLAEMQAHATPEVLADLHGWLFSDWATEAREVVDTYEPEETLRAFAQGLRANPPPKARMQRMVRFVEANQAGAFYVGLLGAMRDAVRSVGTATDDEARSNLPDFSETEQATIAERTQGGALVSFLHRYAPLSDRQLARWTRAYESASGRWYVETYSEAVAQAIRRAGRELAAAL